MTADGLINIAPATPAMWEKVCELLGLSHLLADDRFLTNAGRVQHRQVLQDEFDRALSVADRKTWTDLFLANGVPAGPINTIEDALNDQQVNAMRMVESIKYPGLGEVKHVGLPLELSSIPKGESIYSAAPSLGENSVEVLLELGWDQQTIDQFITKHVIHQA